MSERPGGSALTGRTLLVIGGDRRLTRAIADTAGERGAVVALATMGDGSRDEAGTEEPFDRGTASIPPLDTVIAVVTTQPLPPLHELSIDCWRECATQPLRQAFWVARRAVEGFLADAVDGRLVLVVEPIDTDAGQNDVVESALRSLASSFAREYGRRALACNLVLAHVPMADDDSVVAVVEQALYLASPGASFMNGEALVVRSKHGRPRYGARA